jgi:uracil-DNA glycosylase
VIFGQDPYPGELVADGLAFSTPIINKVPASLRNIFKEYQSDLSLPAPTTSDLTPWSRSGVLLLNRSLTTISGARNAHQASQWKVLTESIAQMLGERDVVAILWGNFARELSPLFALKIESAHPSPLSAHRGFFGSRPFTRANALLEGSGRSAIEWKLG